MIDPYGTVLKMAMQPDVKPEQIAATVGWPVDAVQSLIEELDANRKEHLDRCYFDSSEDEDSARRWR
jgi:hypothetical protein